MAEGEIEYESDPEEAKLSLKMRRREASDDEEVEEEKVAAKEGGEGRKDKLPTRRIEESDGESEGAAAEYEDELYEEYDLDEEYVGEEDEIEYEESIGGRVGDSVEVLVESERDGADAAELRKENRGAVKNNSNDVSEVDAENNIVADGQQEEKKEIEPFAVPTAGAFYMHDDRFRDNAGGRNRRMLGGRKLWESKDDRKWGHDKFEELTLQEKHHDGRRRGSRGRYRSRARNRGSDHEYADGNRPREYTNNSIQNRNNQNSAPKGVRGRGPRRYMSSYKNNKEVHLTQNKQSGRSVEKPSYAISARTTEPSPTAEADVVPRKQVVSSSLSIASPPFYPSGSSAQDIAVPHKSDAQAGTVNQNGQPSVVDESSTTAIMRGKNIVNHVGVDKNYRDNLLSAMAAKSSNALQISLSGSSSTNSTQVQLRGQGRGITSSTQMTYQRAISNNQLSRVPPPGQIPSFQSHPSQTNPQPSAQASNQYFAHVPSRAQTSSPPKAADAVNAFEAGELESPSEPSKSRTALVAKGKYSAQGSGRGSFLYGGAQVVGASANMGSSHGDQNFPTFFPVMQFGGQHPGGIGVPAVGMAFPGYVGGRGNSEMTWLPVLAGAAGALGANFCPPYITVDGSYQARTSAQASAIAAVSSKENSAANLSNDWKPGQRPEPANDDSGQRQKNPRRYTEMKFDQ